MKRIICNLLFALLLAVCVPPLALATEQTVEQPNADSVYLDTANILPEATKSEIHGAAAVYKAFSTDNINEQTIEDGYYYLIAQNGRMLCKNEREVYTTEDYSAATIMYLCKDADGYDIVFANDKRLLTMNVSDDTDRAFFSAECWHGGDNQRFQLVAVDDSDHYMLLADPTHAVVADNLTGILKTEEYSESIRQTWTIKKAGADSDTLPMVSIEIESTDNWESKEDVRYGQLTYSDTEKGLYFTGEISINFQGHSSLEYPKKNYTIKFREEGYEVVPRWGKQKKYCLKANYVDPTHAGNLVSSNLAARMYKAYDLYTDTPNYGQVDGFPVWLTMNGEDIGLYTWNIPKAEWMLGMEKDNPNHLLIGSEGWQEENLMLDENYELGNQWSIEVGTEDETTSDAFARLVHFVVTADDETFKKDIEAYLNLDACLNYYCYICISNATDNTANNLLLATWDGKIWYPLLYDLDSCWGIRAGGLEPVYALVYSRDEYNCRLLERIRDLFPEELRQRYSELRSTVLAEENIENAFYSFVEQIPAHYYLKDWQMWNPDGIYVQSLDLVETRLKEYLPEVDRAFGYYE